MKQKITIYDLKGIPETVEYEVQSDYFRNEDGTLKQNIEPVKVNGKFLYTSGWPIYDVNEGHCGLCGRLRDGVMHDGCCSCQGGS